ncbi:MAG: restriction endonuclease [Solirubrobacteraceae bacterium]|jgi:restriction system protein
MTVWGIHNDHPELDLIGNGFISVGWEALGDLTAIGPDKEALKQRVAQTFPNAKPGAIPVWAGVLLRFGFEMKVGDLVIYPYKPDSTLNFGRIESDYYYEPDVELHRNRRKVQWLKTGIPRAQFSKSARYEVGSAVTLFRVKNHEAEFVAFVNGAAPAPAPDTVPAIAVAADEAAAQAEDEPNAERIETYTRDFIIETLLKELEGVRFEYFVAHLMEAMGYRTHVTQAVGDGGFDVIAHRDALGLEPPIIKVQCKRTVASIGAPDVQKLTGTLAPGGSELGLFVTLGAYSKDAQQLGRTRQDLRLVNGNELVDLIFEHYESFRSEWKRLLPLRRVYVVDREPEAS